MNVAHDLVHRFFDSVTKGELPDDLLTQDVTAWGTMQGAMDGATYKSLIPLLAAVTEGSIRFALASITAEDDRIAVEASSEATLITGAAYRNDYVFIFRVRDGRIAHIAEHFNALVVQETLIPAMEMLKAAS